MNGNVSLLIFCVTLTSAAHHNLLYTWSFLHNTRINGYSIHFMHRNKDSVDIFVVENMIGSIFYLFINRYHRIKYTYDENKRFFNKLVSYRNIVEVVKIFFFLTRRIKVHCK